MSKWVTARLGPLCLKVGSGATPRGGKETYKERGISLIRSQNVYNNRFEKAGLAFIDEEQAKGLSNVEVEPQDVLLNITGDSVARVCQVPDDVLPARVNQHVAIIRPDPEHLDPGFICYWLVSPQTQAHMLSLASAGATRKALTKGMIEDFELPLPRISTQQRIAHILGTLDDKIELNRRMNRTLEAIARAIFKSWFVDFLPVRAKVAARTQTGDPVHAKAEGRAPVGMDPETAALFPDSFQDSPLGKIPKGWEIGTAGDLAALSHDGLKPGDFSDELFEHYSIPAYDKGRIPKVEPGEAIKSNKLFVLPNCVLLSKLNPRIPRVWLPALHDSRRSVSSTEFLVVIPKFGLSRELLYSMFSSDAFMSEFATLVTGTSGSHQRVKPDALLNLGIVVPPLPLVQHFTAAVSGLLDCVAENRAQSRTLASLRDTLLPQLISGELPVKDAKRLAGRLA